MVFKVQNLPEPVQEALSRKYLNRKKLAKILSDEMSRVKLAMEEKEHTMGSDKEFAETGERLAVIEKKLAILETDMMAERSARQRKAANLEIEAAQMRILQLKGEVNVRGAIGKDHKSLSKFPSAFFLVRISICAFPLPVP